LQCWWGVTLLAALLIAALYGNASIAAYLGMVALKQPLVAMALIPLALLNRGLQFDRMATVNVSATLAVALTRLALAFAGPGSWVLAAGYTASGFYLLLEERWWLGHSCDAWDSTMPSSGRYCASACERQAPISWNRCSRTLITCW
jgi:hypothetical protein